MQASSPRVVYSDVNVVGSLNTCLDPTMFSLMGFLTASVFVCKRSKVTVHFLDVVINRLDTTRRILAGDVMSDTGDMTAHHGKTRKLRDDACFFLTKADYHCLLRLVTAPV